MNKYIYFSILFIFLIPKAKGQHLAVSNFYPINQYMVNPAFMNEGNSTLAYLSARDHWSSLPGSPMDLYFGLSYPFQENANGGLRVIGDKQGLFNTFLTEFTYSYQHRLSRDQYLYYGLSAGIETFRLNKGDIVTGTLADPVLDKESYNTMKFTTGVGLYYTNQGFFASASLPRILEHDKLYQTIYGRVGYDIIVNASLYDEVLAFQPSVAIHSIPSSPLQFDINLLTRIQEKLYLQTSYITNKSFITGISVKYQDFFLGYSYEFSIGELAHMSNGSHEIMLSYQINAKQKGKKGVLNNLFKNNKRKTYSSHDKKEKDKKEEQESLADIMKKHQVKPDESYDSYYTVIGAYYELKDAMEFKNKLESELNLDSEIMIRGDGKYFFVYTDKIKDKKEARDKTNELNDSEVKKYINGNAWLYGEKQENVEAPEE